MRHLPIVAACLLLSAGAQAANIQSVSRLEFGPANTIFLADWKGAAIHALTLPPVEATTAGKAFNVLDLESTVSQAVGREKFALEDMVVRPGTGEVYLAVSVGARKAPALLMVRSDGKARRIDIKKMSADTLALKNPTTSTHTFWRDIPERTFTVTDMKWRNGELFVAGLSNQDFQSTLRRISYPFTKTQGMSSVEIFHTTHNQIETRAPIRAMSFADFGGKTYLVAAYTCTPLVTIPLDELKDGAHVHGKAIAELGYGNTPADMLTYSKGESGKQEQAIMLLNYERVANVIPVAQIEAANAKPEIDKPIPFGVISGVDPMQAPLAGAIRVDNLDEKNLVVVRRQLEKGTLELVTVDKGMLFRLSDFISEYTFKQYSYTGKEFQLKYLKPVQDMLMKQEGYPELIKPE